MDNELTATDTPKAKVIWSRLGGQLGVGLCALGFLLVFLGWNGAASVDRLPSQFPYLISGGIAGLCFVVLGVGMLVVQNQRADRAALQATLRELQEALERAGLAQGTGEQRKPFAKPGPRASAASPRGENPDSTQEIPRPDLEPSPVAKARKPRARARKAT
ncbi:MAG: hypothetical protein WD691_00450 [Acidimicrobiales bacterium]